MKLVESGGVRTGFTHRWSRSEAYNPALGAFIAKMDAGAPKARGPEGVAQAISKAATDDNDGLRYTANGSGPMILLNRLLPHKVWRSVIAANFLGAVRRRHDPSRRPIGSASLLV